MEGLLWLLVFGALFYFMMRYGCGAHMVHGHGGHGAGMAHGSHAGHAAQSGTAATVKDPVCGMEVAPGAGFSRVYEGREYRFCSQQCLDRFNAEPVRYAA
jgi:YHS domain-containing protein